MNSQELLHTSRRILISFSPKASLQEQEAALLTFFALSKQGKHVEIEGIPGASRLSLRTPKKEKTFMVTAKGLAPWVSKVYYEKDEKDLRLYFSLQDNKSLSEYMLAVGEQTHDLVLIVGDKDARRNRTEPVVLLNEFGNEKERGAFAAALLSEKELTMARLLVKSFLSLNAAGSDVLVFALSRKDLREAGANSFMLPSLILQMEEYGEPESSYACVFEEQAREHPIRILAKSGGELLKNTLTKHGKVESRGEWLLARSRFLSLREAEEELKRNLSS